MSPSHHLPEERENQILRAAVAVFAERGFAAARMDDIVQESGLSKGTLYWYFKSKDALILALLRHILTGQLKELRTLPVATGTVRDLLLQFVQQFTRALTPFSHHASLTLEFYALAARKDEARAFFRSFFADYKDVLKDIIQQGIDRGEFRAVNPEIVATSILGLFEGAMILFAFGALTMPLQQHCEVTMQFLLEGINI